MLFIIKIQNLLSILKTRIFFFFIIGLHLHIIVYTTSNISWTESKYVWGGPSRSNDFARLPPGFREKKVLNQTKKPRCRQRKVIRQRLKQVLNLERYWKWLQILVTWCFSVYWNLTSSLYKKDIHNEKKLHIWKIFLLLSLSIPFFPINAATK